MYLIFCDVSLLFFDFDGNGSRQIHHVFGLHMESLPIHYITQNETCHRERTGLGKVNHLWFMQKGNTVQGIFKWMQELQKQVVAQCLLRATFYNKS